MSRRLTHILALALAAAVLAAIPAIATAASPEQVNSDCAEDEDLDGSYTNAEKQAALDNMPSEVSSYTDCESIIASSMDNGGPTAGTSKFDGGPADGDGNTASGGGGGDGGSAAAGGSKKGGARAKSPAHTRQIARAVTERKLGKRGFDPRTIGAIDTTKTANGLPLPVLLALIAVALLLLAGAAVALGRRNPALVDATLRRVRVPRRRG